MRLTWRDGLASLFVTAAAVLYALWLTGAGGAGMSTRAIGALVFGLGWAACASNKAGVTAVYGAAGGRSHAPMAYIVMASLVGLIALVAGVITLVSANEAMLGTLVAGMVALWAMSTVRHAIATESRRDDHAIQEPLQKAA